MGSSTTSSSFLSLHQTQNIHTNNLISMAEISSLSSLLKRLEAATTKLEDLAMAGASASNVSSSLTGNSGAHAPQGQLSQLGETAPAGGASAGQEGSHPHVEAFDELVEQYVKTYYELSKVIGGLVEQQVRAHLLKTRTWGRGMRFS
jgi:adenylyl cyclase-associated protein